MLYGPQMQVQQAGQKRRVRQPVHTFQLRHRAFQIQPFMIAPVLAGETLKNALFQIRAVTDPVKNPLIGWWLHHYLFYVKMTDLVSLGAAGTTHYSDDLQNMLLHNTSPSSFIRASTDTAMYAADGGMKVVEQCLYRIVDCYFRSGDENHDVAAGLLDTVPMMHARGPGWMDSLQPKATVDAMDVEVADISAQTTFSGADDKIKAEEIYRAMEQWRLASVQGLTTQTWDEYLATYGIRPPQTKMHMPELIRQSKVWQYPSNTIDPTTGAPRSAVSWSVAERADKDRFFSEPGWVVGVTIAQPKVYFGKQLGHFAGYMLDAYKWMPAHLYQDLRVAYANFSATADAPLDPAFITAEFTADIRDLFEYGDQFLNFALTEVDGNIVALPSADLTNKRYVADADVDALFVTPATLQDINQDGVCHLSIATHLPRELTLEGSQAGLAPTI